MRCSDIEEKHLLRSCFLVTRGLRFSSRDSCFLNVKEMCYRGGTSASKPPESDSLSLYNSSQGPKRSPCMAFMHWQSGAAWGPQPHSVLMPGRCLCVTLLPDPGWHTVPDFLAGLKSLGSPWKTSRRVPQSISLHSVTSLSTSWKMELPESCRLWLLKN